MNDGTEYRQAVIHLGTNDVNSKHKDTMLNEYMQITTMIRSKWPACKIIMSGIIEHRSDREKNRMIKEVNEELRGLTRDLDNVEFLDNSRLTRRTDGGINDRVYYDDLHLNNQTGTRILAANLKDVLGLRQNNQTDRQTQANRYVTRRTNEIPPQRGWPMTSITTQQHHERPPTYQTGPGMISVNQLIELLNNISQVSPDHFNKNAMPARQFGYT